MKIYLLKGHERPITQVKFNVEGDLLFSSSRDYNVTVWRTENGERIGSYSGHNGAVLSVDCNADSTNIITGSSDFSTRLWDAETGKTVFSCKHPTSVKSVEYALGEKLYMAATETQMGKQGSIVLWDPREQPTKPVLEFNLKGDQGLKIMKATFGPLNKTIIVACEDGTIRQFDASTGDQMEILKSHNKAVMDIAWGPNKYFFLSASRDGYAKLYDAKTLEHMKTFNQQRPLNSGDISPMKEEVILAGGQSAAEVTQTRVDSTQFRVKFYHLIYEEEVGTLQSAHFAPVNSLRYLPDGTGFASGGEDGYVRLHKFDENYFTKNFD